MFAVPLTQSGTKALSGMDAKEEMKVTCASCHRSLKTRHGKPGLQRPRAPVKAAPAVCVL